MASTERLNKSGDRIEDSRRTMFETEDLGVSILQDLHAQRQSLLQCFSSFLTLFAVEDMLFCLLIVMSSHVASWSNIL
ncbi:hypothetical protein AHAS_Ahas12G0117500 [Arachis hypogaea]